MCRSYSKDYNAGGVGRTPSLQYTPIEPLQAVKDAVHGFTDYLNSVDSADRVGLVVYGSRGAVDPFSSSNGLTNDFDAISELPYPHQPGEQGAYTNTGDGIVRGYRMVYGSGSREYAPQSHCVHERRVRQLFQRFQLRDESGRSERAGSVGADLFDGGFRRPCGLSCQSS